MAGRFLYSDCPVCFTISTTTEGISYNTFYKLFNHMNENKHLILQCNCGHETVIIVNELLFETLLHVAFDDFDNQYYRESVFNFSAAQERFFEFVIGLLCFESEPDYSEYKNVWKNIENQSERQLGAFIFLYFRRFHDVPFLKTDFENNSKIRNKVIHKGKTPTREETKNYGSFVINTIHSALKNILEQLEPSIVLEFRKIKIDEAWKARGDLPENVIGSTHLASEGIVSWRVENDETIERNRRVSKFSAEHPKEIAAMAIKANEQNKIIGVDDSGNLILVDPIDYSKRDPTAKYRGSKDFDGYIAASHFLKEFYLKCEKGLISIPIIDKTRD